MRGSYSGNTLAFQANAESSILLPRSNFPKKVYMALSLSRGPTIDTEKCVEQVGGNRFNLVLIAAARSRELARRHKDSESTKQLNAPVTALLDIQSGKVGKEYLKKVQ